MIEYINKQAAIIEMMDNDIDHTQGTDGREVVQILEDMPAADVTPVVHGRWLSIVSYNNTYKCSECGRLLVDIADGLKMVAKHYPYCHCGAKMDSQGEE